VCAAASSQLHALTRSLLAAAQSYQRAEREAASLARKQASYGLLLPDEEARAHCAGFRLRARFCFRFRFRARLR
jgi:hypothetical protein